jgi:pentatricopeptide repeat protein
MEDFDTAFSYEALARAYALNGELKKTAEMFKSAVEAGKLIKDEEDRKIFSESLNSGVLTQFG